MIYYLEPWAWLIMAVGPVLIGLFFSWLARKL
ncbi:hypothetical protein [Escherichia phage UPEC01]|uniref:Uncharacterized protein n=3 Tax=Gaprivervirus TaxID=1913654 RepID=A0A0A7HCI7_9CAUD|nr:hypothetical protein VR7_gp105 [Escherichia phage vB_EcoM_VR7]YP_009209845.1 hypothetical protein AVV67_gp103 [Escherichia phage vB_EcoM_VR25]YP_009213938.1 hypothetical protein AVV66_gp101 [Escherichia phage vB_EcoM_VR26]QQG30806.1 hypothetical protein [Escherichia phage UPEC01]ADR32480.1 hypothetical protein VR7_gp105 [Escherichia phage vB_EcoM_VR7]AIZ02447.1 hypothetical protein VR25_103 [Escherichia phage vB_EcoM_VR25]AIZ02738.1 hypothetical protein VR26_101 [Escherichia phage vB_EcoM_